MKFWIILAIILVSISTGIALFLLPKSGRMTTVKVNSQRHDKMYVNKKYKFQFTYPKTLGITEKENTITLVEKGKPVLILYISPLYRPQDQPVRDYCSQLYQPLFCSDITSQRITTNIFGLTGIIYTYAADRQDNVTRNDTEKKTTQPFYVFDLIQGEDKRKLIITEPDEKNEILQTVLASLSFSPTASGSSEIKSSPQISSGSADKPIR